MRMRSRAFRARRIDQLQRDGGLQDQVVGAPDIAHAAAADPRDHPIAAREHLAGGETASVGLLVRV